MNEFHEFYLPITSIEDVDTFVQLTFLYDDPHTTTVFLDPPNKEYVRIAWISKVCVTIGDWRPERGSSQAHNLYFTDPEQPKKLFVLLCGVFDLRF